MILTHLTAVGPNVPPSTVEFGVRLTVIYGASDTGKSYIAEAIDFVMGSSSLKSIPEAEGYTHLILGVRFPGDQDVTLIRPIVGDTKSDKISVFPGRHLQVPGEKPEMLLARKHNPNSTKNVSRYLLDQVGLDGNLVRRNAYNQLRLLSFRDVARLCMINETDMQSKTSPILSGQWVQATAEKSVFKLFVDGHDDSSFAGPDQSPDQRKVSKGKAELLDQLLGDLRRSVTNAAGLAELRQRHTHVIASIEGLSESVASAVQERDRLLAARDNARVQMSADRTRLGEINELLSRFTLLREQYESDIDRLDMIREVGDLLGYFDRGVCVFCGARVEDQRPPSGHVISEMTELAEVVNAERAKTVMLRDDLGVTLTDVSRQGAEIQASLRRWEADHSELGLALDRVEEDLAPKDRVLAELLAARSDVERQIGSQEQIEKLEGLRGDLVVGYEVPEAAGKDISTHQLAVLGTQIAGLLTTWGIPDSSTVDFDLDTYDLIVNGQARSSRGKGIRAVFHAAYTLGLALHRRAANGAYPGFLILDSPLITYRGPEVEAVSTDGEFVSQSVADAFFRFLASNPVGQVIVFENTDPPNDLEHATITYFTKSRELGRYGYFPPISNTGQLW